MEGPTSSGGLRNRLTHLNLHKTWWWLWWYYGAYKKNTFHATVSSQQRLLIILKKEYFRNIYVFIARDMIHVYKQIPYHFDFLHCYCYNVAAPVIQVDAWFHYSLISFSVSWKWLTCTLVFLQVAYLFFAMLRTLHTLSQQDPFESHTSWQMFVYMLQRTILTAASWYGKKHTTIRFWYYSNMVWHLSTSYILEF
jgi:hypothetical protein